jgi:hypothetical protein
MLDGCEFRHIRVGGFEYVVQGKQYKKLAQQPFWDSRFRTLVEVHRYFDNKKPEIVGYLKDSECLSSEPQFVSVQDPEYLCCRAVFIGYRGLLIANQTLLSLSKFQLARGIDLMLSHRG